MTTAARDLICQTTVAGLLALYSVIYAGGAGYIFVAVQFNHTSTYHCSRGKRTAQETDAAIPL